MNTQVISVNNQKGGVGKTTTALAMAAILAKAEGKRVLLIDCDGSSTTLTKILCRQVGRDYESLETTLTDLLLMRTLGRDFTAAAEQAILPCPEGYDLLPADNKLVSIAAALSLQNDMDIRFRSLSTLTDHYRDAYDFIILDAAPVLDLFAVNQLFAADRLLIVSQCQKASREAIHELQHTIDAFVKPMQKDLPVDGILLTMLDRRAKYGKQQAAEMQEEFSDLYLYHATIPRATDGERYVGSGYSIFTAAPKSKPAFAYQEFVTEFLKRERTERHD